MIKTFINLLPLKVALEWFCFLLWSIVEKLNDGFQKETKTWTIFLVSLWILMAKKWRYEPDMSFAFEASEFAYL